MKKNVLFTLSLLLLFLVSFGVLTFAAPSLDGQAQAANYFSKATSITLGKVAITFFILALLFKPLGRLMDRIIKDDIEKAAEVNGKLHALFGLLSLVFAFLHALNNFTSTKLGSGTLTLFLLALIFITGGLTKRFIDKFAYKIIHRVLSMAFLAASLYHIITKIS